MCSFAVGAPVVPHEMLREGSMRVTTWSNACLEEGGKKAPTSPCPSGSLCGDGSALVMLLRLRHGCSLHGRCAALCLCLWWCGILCFVFVGVCVCVCVCMCVCVCVCEREI